MGNEDQKEGEFDAKADDWADWDGDWDDEDYCCKCRFYCTRWCLLMGCMDY